MLNKKIVGILLLVAAILLTSTVGAAWWSSEKEQNSGEVTELQWEDLLPEGFKPPTNPLDKMTTEEINKLFDGSEESLKEIERLEVQMSYAPTDDKYHGKLVKIPGYIVPLDFDGQTQMKEFLLVPYYGACIHSPPPPANQVVHGVADELLTVEDTYYPVWAVGVLSTQSTKTDLAEAGYQLKVDKLLPYEEPTEK